MQAIVALILANLPEIIKLGQAGYNLIVAARAAMQQSGEWTADMELAFQSKLAAEAIDPAWLPDSGAVAVTVKPAPVVASAAAVTCPVCSKELIPDHPANCNCSPA